MITLHGIYNNGKLIIKEKKLPKIKAKADIYIFEEEDQNKEKIILGQYDLKGSYDKKNIRDLAYE